MIFHVVRCVSTCGYHRIHLTRCQLNWQLVSSTATWSDVQPEAIRPACILKNIYLFRVQVFKNSFNVVALKNACSQSSSKRFGSGALLPENTSAFSYVCVDACFCSFHNFPSRRSGKSCARRWRMLYMTQHRHVRIMLGNMVALKVLLLARECVELECERRVNGGGTNYT